jgi:hypothetical protein
MMIGGPTDIVVEPLEGNGRWGRGCQPLHFE